VRPNARENDQISPSIAVRTARGESSSSAPPACLARTPEKRKNSRRFGFIWRISVKTTVRGNVSYQHTDIEPEHLTETGQQHAKWETERAVADPVEYEAAQKIRSKVSRFNTCETKLTA
jgi:hypothetical protein